jgi:hypothetical protein
MKLIKDQRKLHNEGFEVLTAVRMTMLLFWVVTSCEEEETVSEKQPCRWRQK